MLLGLCPRSNRTSLLVLLSDSSRKLRISWPWLAWMRPSANRAPPSLKGLGEAPLRGRYGDISARPCKTPRHTINPTPWILVLPFQLSVTATFCRVWRQL